jgi:hypothetical protein
VPAIALGVSPAIAVVAVAPAEAVVAVGAAAAFVAVGAAAEPVVAVGAAVVPVVAVAGATVAVSPQADNSIESTTIIAMILNHFFAMSFLQCSYSLSVIRDRMLVSSSVVSNSLVFMFVVDWFAEPARRIFHRIDCRC